VTDPLSHFPSLPPELRGDFPEPVHGLAAQKIEVRPIKQQFDLMEAARKYQEAKYILGKFPTDRGSMHDGGPIDPDFSYGSSPIGGPPPEFVLPREYRHSPYDARVWADSITCGPPGSPRETTVDTHCPCGRHLEVAIPRALSHPPSDSLRRAP
jgi:hypothetical protein